MNEPPIAKALPSQDQTVRVHCLDCGIESNVAPNRILCPRCSGYRTILCIDEWLSLGRIS